MLTVPERKKFAAFLHREAEQDAALAEQMQKIGMPEAVQKQMRTRALAKKLVAEDLESWEAQTVSADTQPEGESDA